MRPSKECATELMRGSTGRVRSMAHEVGGRRHGVVAQGRRKGRVGVRARWPDWPAGLARGDGPNAQWADGKEKKKLEFNFELISKFRKIE
jgi:hypothetical protein